MLPTTSNTIKFEKIARFLFKIERLLFGWRSECMLHPQRDRHLILLPGLGGSVRELFPLVRYARKHQLAFGVTAIPLGYSAAEFEPLVAIIIDTVRNLHAKQQVSEIRIFGHSHGGRVASEAIFQMQSLFPGITFGLVTAGTPMVTLPTHLPTFITRIWKMFSRSIREWHAIRQPDPKSLSCFLGFYSGSDWIVPSNFATDGYQGTLVHVPKFFHRSFLSPRRMGPLLLESLSK